MTIQPIPEGKKISTYELANVLEKTAAALKALPLTIINNVKDEEQTAYQNIEWIIKGVNNRLAELEKNLATSETELIAACDAHYNRTGKAIRDLNDKLKQLPDVENIRFPYNLKETIEIAERLNEMPDEQWKRFLELVNVLAR